MTKNRITEIPRIPRFPKVKRIKMITVKPRFTAEFGGKETSAVNRSPR